MPRISQEKKEKIAEQILHHLFSVAPKPLFTAQIAREIARDEEFTKSLLTELKDQKLIIEVNKNNQGQEYIKRQRWRLSNQIHEVYNNHQSKHNNI